MTWLLDYWGIIAFGIGSVMAVFAWLVRLEVRLAGVEKEAKVAAGVHKEVKETIDKIFDKLDKVSEDVARMAGACMMCRQSKE